MKYKDNIEWLKSLKRQIGQTQHRDLWHFEQVIDETIENLKPLAKLHGRLIDADKLNKKLERHRDMCGDIEIQYGIDMAIRILNNTQTIIKAEVSE